MTVPEGGSARFGFQFNTRPAYSVVVRSSHGEGDDDLRSQSSTSCVISPDEWENPYKVRINARHIFLS